MNFSRISDVTVIIPTFNRADLILRTLESIGRQILKPEQVIIVDDASTDATVPKIKHWAKNCNFNVKIEVLAFNSGPAKARNRGMELANTKYVAFLDSDDEYIPEALFLLMAAFEIYPNAVLSFADAKVITDESGEISPTLLRHHINANDILQKDGPNAKVYQLRDPVTKLLRASIIPTSATCFLLEAARRVGGMPIDYRSGEDWLFWLRLASQGEFVFQLAEVAIHHRHERNLTHPGSSEFLSRQKLLGYVALARNSVGIELDDKQRMMVKTLLNEQLRSWRYHLSMLGFRTYLAGLSSMKQLGIGTPTAHILTDLRSFFRGIYQSIKFFTRNNQHRKDLRNLNR